MEMPSVYIGNYIYEEGDDLSQEEKEEYEALLPKKLNHFIHSESNHGFIIYAKDFVTNLSIDIITHHEVINLTTTKVIYFQLIKNDNRK